MNQSCELFYASGGHGGPYQNVKLAVEAAKRLLRGNKSEHSIEVRASDFKTVIHTVSRYDLDKEFTIVVTRGLKREFLFMIQMSYTGNSVTKPEGVYLVEAKSYRVACQIMQKHLHRIDPETWGSNPQELQHEIKELGSSLCYAIPKSGLQKLS